MNEIETAAPEALNETPDTSVAPSTQAQNTLNATDGVPALGGATNDEIRLRNSGPITFEKLDDALFAAVMAGDEVQVRARLGGSDKPLTEAEEIILVRTRQIEEEMAYERMLAAADADNDGEEDDAPQGLSFSEGGHHHAGHFALLEGLDAYGGRFDRKRSRYRDRFGGTYDIYGRTAPDGSYTTYAGDRYDAETHTVRFAVGGEHVLAEHLRGHGDDVLRLAARIAKIRAEARAEMLAGETSDKAAVDAAAKAVDQIIFAAPRAMAAACESDEAFTAKMAAMDAAEKARFEAMATNERFQKAANETDGGGMGYGSCPCVTSKEFKLAADILGENILNGNIPVMLSRYHYKSILDMADDAEDAIAARLKPAADRMAFNLAALPTLSSQANDVFARTDDTSVDIGFNLKDKADAVFARKAALPAVQEALALITGKPRNLLRRAGQTLTA